MELLPFWRDLDPFTFTCITALYTMMIGILIVAIIFVCQFHENQKRHVNSAKDAHDKKKGKLRGISRKRRVRYDGVYYLSCLNGKEWARFYPNCDRRGILNTQCKNCGGSDIDLWEDEDRICYECDAHDGCWCCSIYCYNQLLLKNTFGFTTFHPKCLVYHIGYVRDRVNGYNQCKLNIYQSNYELNLQLLIFGYLQIDSNMILDCIMNIIIMYFNTRITSFHPSLLENRCLSLESNSNIILQTKQECSVDLQRVYYTATYSDMILSANDHDIYYALIKCIEAELNGFYIGIIPIKYGIPDILTTSPTNIPNCYVYGNNGNCYNNSVSKGAAVYHGWIMKCPYRSDDIIKCIIDLKFGVISFNINDSSPHREPVAFRINKDIEYRLIVATCHRGDKYQLL